MSSECSLNVLQEEQISVVGIAPKTVSCGPGGPKLAILRASVDSARLGKTQQDSASGMFLFVQSQSAPRSDRLALVVLQMRHASGVAGSGIVTNVSRTWCCWLW